MNILASVGGSRAVIFALSSALDIGFNNSLVDASTGANTTGAISGTVAYTNVLPAVGTHSAMFTSTSATKAYAQYTSVTANVSTAMTVMLWLKVTGVVDTGSPVYFDVGSPASGSYGVYLSRAANQAYDSKGTVDKNYSVCGSSSTFALKDNTWYHLVFVVTNGSSTVGWYRNGVAQTALTGASTAAYPAITTSINTVRIGSSISATDKGLIGLIDRFQIYAGDAGTAALAMYAAGNGYVGSFNDMNLYYTFDALDATSTFFRDQVSGDTNTGNALDRKGCTLDTVNKKFGAGSINNAGAGWSRTVNNTFTFSSGSHSFSFWVLPASNAGASGGWLFTWSGSTYTSYSVGLKLKGSTEPYGLTAVSDNTTAVQSLDVTTSNSLVVGTWYHVVVIFSTVDKTCSLYLNGIFQSTVTFSQAINTTDARIYRDILSYPGRSSIANIDDFRYYARGLSAADVKTLYNYST